MLNQVINNISLKSKKKQKPGKGKLIQLPKMIKILNSDIS
jgi:hypothetical protein